MSDQVKDLLILLAAATLGLAVGIYHVIGGKRNLRRDELYVWHRRKLTGKEAKETAKFQIYFGIFFLILTAFIIIAGLWQVFACGRI